MFSDNEILDVEAWLIILFALGVAAYCGCVLYDIFTIVAAAFS